MQFQDMSESISKYFATKLGGSKRRQSSSSSSEPSLSPNGARGEVEKQNKKKTRLVSEESREECSQNINMEEIQSALDCINRKLAEMCTREDILSVKSEMTKMSETFSRRLDILEGSLFDLNQKKDELSAEVTRLKRENTDLRGRLDEQEAEDRRLRASHNDLEQHGRLWNVRVYGVAEATNPKDETAADCVQKCVDIFSRKVGVPVRPEDIEVAHRSGKQVGAQGGGKARPRPVLVRFFSRQIKRNVLSERRKLKNSGISISEDLTSLNYKLMKQATEHSATLSAWSSNGKILAKLKNGLVVVLSVSENLDETVRKRM